MAFEAARQAGAFLAEYGKLMDNVDQACHTTVERLVQARQLSESAAGEFLLELVLHTRIRVLSLWEHLDSPEAPPVPSHF